MDESYVPTSSLRSATAISKTSFSSPLITHWRINGLGLPLVKEIIEKYGGRISFVSERGAGSIFTMIFQSQSDCLQLSHSIQFLIFSAAHFRHTEMIKRAARAAAR